MFDLKPRKRPGNTPKRAAMVLVGLLCGSTASSGAQSTAKPDAFPNLSSVEFGWIKDSDSFVPAPSGGPGPVTFDPAHPYQPNNDEGLQVTWRVADLTNPILKPWAV